MKVALNIFNLSDRPLRLLQIFFDKLLHGYNVEIILFYSIIFFKHANISELFVNELQ